MKFQIIKYRLIMIEEDNKESNCEYYKRVCERSLIEQELG